jgi:hypothetical protein
MTRTVRILLAGCAALFMLGAVGVFFAVRYVSSNKNRLLAEGQEVRASGRAFGESHKESECVTQALVRYRRERTMKGAIRTRLWLASCLRNSSPEDGFCRGLPSEFDLVRSSLWPSRECARRGLRNDTGCSLILDEVQVWCYSVTREWKASPEGQASP